MMLYTGWLLAALLPVFLVYGLRWRLGRDHLQPIWTYPLLVLAGGLGGTFFGLVGSHLLAPWFGELAADQGSSLVLSVVVVPLAEETGKALILLVLLLTVWYRSAIDGLLFGFAAGAGYATFETLFAFTVAHANGDPGGWAEVMALRLFPATILHGSTTALVGVYLGAARWERRPLVVFATLPSALLLATLIHGGWNGLTEIAATETGVRHALLALGALPALGLVFWLLLRASSRIEALIIRDELEPVVRAGLLTPFDLEAVTDDHQRRGLLAHPFPPARRLAGAAVGLAFALRGQRLERRGTSKIERFRTELVRAHPHSGRLSPPD